MNKLSFCFLLSVYSNDKPNYVNDCLLSIINQSVKADETIIVIEGSINSDLKKVLDSFDNKIKNLKLLYLEKQFGPMNYGLPACLNYGMLMAKSDFIVRIDSDDINHTDRIKKIKEILHLRPEIKLGGSNITEYDEKMNKKIKNRVVPEHHNFIKKFSKYRNPFNGPAVFFHKETALKLGGYPLIASNEDYCLWVSFLKYNLPTYNIQENLVYMRAGNEIIKRRSGYRYTKGEWDSIRYIYGIGYFNFINYLFHIITRTLIRILPVRAISIIYSIFLRK